MERRFYLDLAADILAGKEANEETLSAMANLPETRVFDLLVGTDMIREAFFGRSVHLCTIINAKCGKCPEDCAFCSQSAFAKTQAPVYPLISKEEVQEGARAANQGEINRFSAVTSGKRLSSREVEKIAAAFQDLEPRKTHYCASLGTLDKEDMRRLKDAGISRYHHNLETAESFFEHVCTTHTYQDRRNTIIAAKEVGLSACVGGLFGMGETDEQVLELAMAIKALGVDAVPINFLSPIKGTRFENHKGLTPMRCLKIIALFRYVLPDTDILICGGREANLKTLHPLIFYAGASGIMTGNYLTTAGRTLEQDLDLLEQLQFSVRSHG
jgi:biotin synthase